ncbi:TonB-dependent receptor domain-containing protein [Gemmatimonadota bacterium]
MLVVVFAAGLLWGSSAGAQVTETFDSAADSKQTGSLHGQVLDRYSQAPIIGVSVSVEGLGGKSTTGTDGRYVIDSLPVGSYTLAFRMLGCRPLAQTDVIVRSNRITFANAALEQVAMELEGLVVVAGSFPEEESQPNSIVGFSGEEIRRAPGSGQDVSRIVASLPSVAKVDDQTNSLIVRGGSPMENSFYVDNIEIPNINHFPTQGASGGPIGLINVDFIDAVDFRTGGFSATYGDRLSSVMDIRFRDGNRSEFDGQLDLSLMGFGGVFEGPLMNGKGSWLVSARRSYLDLIIKMVNVGSTVAPQYGDYQGKVVYDLNSNNRLSVLAVLGDDHMHSDSTVAVENAMVHFGDQDLATRTVGFNWRALWGGGVSNTSLSYSTNRFDETGREASTGLFIRQNRSSEHTIALRNVNRRRMSGLLSTEFGVDAKHLVADFDNVYAAHTDALGGPVPETVLSTRIEENKLGAFASLIVRPFARLSATVGMRVDHFTFNDNTHLSPRLSLNHRVSDRTTVNAATGIYYQSLPMVLLAQNAENRQARDPRAIHYVVGLSHLLTDYAKLSVELFHKEYADSPIDPDEPSLLLVDELFYRYGFYTQHAQLSDSGRARATGVEVTLQKRLARDFYGLVSAAYSRARYRGSDLVWRNRVFDNRVVFGIEGGYKPSRSWEFSARWIFAGGAPYTPLDVVRSAELHRAVLDADRINEDRYPHYHSLNVRFDRRFHFSRSNLIAYLSVWNAYNRKNVASYYWNELNRSPDLIYQWSALPIFGLEFEF